MLQHSFVLDALEDTGADTFTHFEVLIEEHRQMEDCPQPSRLQQLVPTIHTFHTPLPLRKAFEVYNEKHRLTKRKHIQISFNEIRHILNLAQIMALRQGCVGLDSEESAESLANSSPNLPPETTPCSQLQGPRLISFDGDQTLYSDGANFEGNPQLAHYLYLLLRHGCAVAVVTAAGYEYNVEKYEYRLSGLLRYFQSRGLATAECERFYLFGGECNYLLRLGSDYRLHPVKEFGPGGWCTSTKFLPDAPANWDDAAVQAMLDASQETAQHAVDELKLRGRVIRKKRSVGLVPNPGLEMPRESLDEVVLRAHEKLHTMNDGTGPGLPYCAFNGGTDVWVDVGNKRVGMQVLQAYLGVPPAASLHIGDQFLNTGNDYAARAVSPCIWIISPQETTYILKMILRLSGIGVAMPEDGGAESDESLSNEKVESKPSVVDFQELERRSLAIKSMDVYTGEMK